MTNIDGMHDEELPLNQKPICFKNWIQHIKTMGNQSLSIVYWKPLTRK